MNLIFHFLVLHVFNPTIEYKGQKLTRLVKAKTMEITIKTIPNVLVTVPVKYNAAKTIAKNKRIMRSVPPIFFFMIYNFLFMNISYNPNRHRNDYKT